MMPLVESGRSGRDKVVSAVDAVQLIRDGDTVAIGGFGGIGFAEELIMALEERYLKSGRPRDLTLILPVAQSDMKGRGVGRQARHAVASWPGHLRRSAPRRWQGKRAHHRGPDPAHHGRW